MRIQEQPLFSWMIYISYRFAMSLERKLTFRFLKQKVLSFRGLTLWPGIYIYNSNTHTHTHIYIYIYGRWTGRRRDARAHAALLHGVGRAAMVGMIREGRWTRGR